MRKHLIICLMIILLMMSLFATTYAWFTFIQRRSVATLTASELKFEVLINQDTYQGLFDIDNLVFIDYEDDFILNHSGLLDEMASIIRLDIKLDQKSPVSFYNIELESSDDALIYILLFEGIDAEQDSDDAISFHELILTIIDPHSTKNEQRLAINQYNQSILDYVASLTIYPLDNMTIKIALWGDYNSLNDPVEYHSFIAQFKITIRAQSNVGG